MSFVAGLGTMRKLYGSITCVDGWDPVANSDTVQYRLVSRRFTETVSGRRHPLWPHILRGTAAFWPESATFITHRL